jgi:aminopeptidase N
MTRGARLPGAIAYALHIVIDSDARAVSGEWCMTVDCGAAPQPLVLDYRGAQDTAALTINGVAGRAARDGDRIVVRSDALRPGENVLAMPIASPVAASGTPVLRGGDGDEAFVYSLFVPAEASALFPCIDRPDARAHFALALTLPPEWTAVSCAPIARQTGRRVEFASTLALPTYAFAFAAGPFAVIADPDARVPARVFVRQSRAAALRDDALAALRLAGHAIAWGERFFDAPFPFPKHDLVLIPAFPFGGMEHAGATFLDESAVALGARPVTTTQTAHAAQRRRAQLVFHETAHQWLGDAVTMRAFDDLWLKEGFANLCAALVADDAGHAPWLAFHRLKMTAVRQDLTTGAVPVRRPGTAPQDAKALYGPAVYGKAPALLRQARHLLGEEEFLRGVRSFVSAHAYGAADCDDLADALQAGSGRPMREWLHAWLDHAGVPTLRLELATHEGRIATARVVRDDAHAAASHRTQRLEAIALDADGTVMRTPYLLDRPAIELDAWRGRPVPRVAFPDTGDYAYARVLLDPATRDAVLADLGAVPDALLRLQLVESLWEHVRDADLDPVRFVDMALARIADEPDHAVTAALVEHAALAVDRYVSPAAATARRDALAAFRRVRGLDAAVPLDPLGEAFAARAALPDPVTKAQCFDTLLHDAALPDRWVEVAAARFNAVDQCALTLPYLRPALDALPRLAETRRIFFADRWLAAFMAGHRDAAALVEVERFLGETALPDALRLKVLEHADGLARAIRIHDRYAAA